MKLSDKSRKLMLFFTKNKHINKLDHSRKTETTLKELYNDIMNSYKYLMQLKQKGSAYFSFNIKKLLNASQITKPKNFNYKNFPDIVRKQIDDLSIPSAIWISSDGNLIEFGERAIQFGFNSAKYKTTMCRHFLLSNILKKV